jgi:hypothetical protein
VHQFNARNKAEIASVRETAANGLANELAWMWGADRGQKLGELMRIYADVQERLQGSSLTDAAWIKCQNLSLKLIHDMNEMTGQLPTRTTVEVSPVPTFRTEVVGWDIERWLDRSDDGRGSTNSEPASPEPAPSPTPEPARAPASTPAPAPASDGPITYGASADSGSSIFRSMSF